ncbi:MAG TPA: 6-phosphogluconolactonase [Thermoanaerobaculia bacterium]|nr:6-phosphogluconolactonase [Thermoanaerobaculia bacterium]
MNIRIFDSNEDLVRATARTITQRVQPGVPASIAISGGSSPKPLYTLLGQSDELAQTPITWVVVDERYVPMSDPQSNAAMIERTLFANGMSPSHRFLRFETELNDPQRTAEKFESDWRAHAITDLDLILLGIGDDGHTASLFPGTPVLDVEDRIAAAVFVPKLDQWRVTITKPVIRAAKLRLVFTAGASKAPIVRGVRDGADYPITAATSGVETWWMMDREAASAL